MPVVYQQFISRADLRRNPNILYLFGDNEQRRGLGGQAKEMRGEPNAVGIRVKVRPNTDEEAYWTDKTFYQNRQNIYTDLGCVHQHLRLGGIVVIPSAGIGTDRAKLNEYAPQTFAYLQKCLSELETIKCP